MDEFTLGELTLMEISLCQFLKDIDVNMAAGQQVNQAIGKIEMQINRLTAAGKDQNSDALIPPASLVPSAE